MRTLYRTVITTSAAILLGACAEAPVSDPLPSWNEGDTKARIVAFVEQVADPASPDYVPPASRVVVFDNDGTLWSEKPVYFQLYFVLDRLRELAPEHPEWQDEEPFASALRGDVSVFERLGMGALVKLVLTTHAGMTTAEFQAEVREWLQSARHPETGQPYTAMVYQPMLELLDYLRANEFDVWIVSGGGIEFLRVWAEDIYGIPPDHIVGTRLKTQFENSEAGPVLMREAQMEFVNDGEGKPVGINTHIGRRPIAAFGNSDGDLAMLQWVAAGDGLALSGYVHHTDAEREWAYDRESSVGRLDKGLDTATANGWLLIDMQRDWAQIYPAAAD